MDRPDADPRELARALAFLRTVNRRLGGAKVLLRILHRDARSWPADRPVRLLDVGTGSADIPLAVVRWARSNGRRVIVTAVDAHPATIKLASEHIGGEADIELLCAHALTLRDRFASGSFDYAHAGMFLHHLQDVEVVTMLAIMQHVARRRVVVNDLVRGVIGSLGMRLLSLRAPPLVKHDGPASVRAGFTKREIIDLATRAELPRLRYRVHLGYRFTLTSDGARWLAGSG